MASGLQQKFALLSGCCKECQDIGVLKKKHDFLSDKDLSDRELVLLNACKKGHAECLKVSLAAGADVNFQVKEGFYTILSPLGCALDSGNDKCVEALIKAGAGVTEKCCFLEQ